jgi:hypothetical protein
MKTEEQRRLEKVLEGLNEFVLNRVTNIRELLQTDVVRAKQELGNHVGELIMRPQPDTGSYVVEGEWDLLGARFPGGQTTSRT